MQSLKNTALGEAWKCNLKCLLYFITFYDSIEELQMFSFGLLAPEHLEEVRTLSEAYNACPVIRHVSNADHSMKKIIHLKKKITFFYLPCLYQILILNEEKNLWRLLLIRIAFVITIFRILKIRKKNLLEDVLVYHRKQYNASVKIMLGKLFKVY